MYRKIRVLLAAVLIMAAVQPAVLAGTYNAKYEEYAVKLKELGVFKGTGSGFELDRKPTRLEAAVMFARLLGAEAQALEKKYTHPFTDVPGWASDIVGYLYNQKLTNGTSASTFGSNDTIGADAYFTFILRALGYNDAQGDFKWNKSLDFARDNALLQGSAVEELRSDTFLRDHLAKISFDALNMPVKGISEQTLAEKLVDSGALDQAVVESIGLSDPADGNSIINADGNNTINSDPVSDHIDIYAEDHFGPNVQVLYRSPRQFSSSVTDFDWVTEVKPEAEYFTNTTGDPSLDAKVLSLLSEVYEKFVNTRFNGGTDALLELVHEKSPHLKEFSSLYLDDPLYSFSFEYIPARIISVWKNDKGEPVCVIVKGTSRKTNYRNKTGQEDGEISVETEDYPSCEIMIKTGGKWKYFGKTVTSYSPENLKLPWSSSYEGMPWETNLNMPRLTEGLSIEIKDGKAMIRINRSALPDKVKDFKKINIDIRRSGRGFSLSDANYIMLGSGYTYDDQRGFVIGTRDGQWDTDLTSALVILHDDSDKPFTNQLGYFLTTIDTE